MLASTSCGDGGFEFYDPLLRWTDGALVDAYGNPVDPVTAPRCRYWSGLNAAYKDVIVHLNADRAVSYGVVAKTMTAVDRAGITKLSVLTVSE